MQTDSTRQEFRNSTSCTHADFRFRISTQTTTTSSSFHLTIYVYVDGLHILMLRFVVGIVDLCEGENIRQQLDTVNRNGYFI